MIFNKTKFLNDYWDSLTRQADYGRKGLVPDILKKDTETYRRYDEMKEHRIVLGNNLFNSLAVVLGFHPYSTFDKFCHTASGERITFIRKGSEFDKNVERTYEHGFKDGAAYSMNSPYATFKFMDYDFDEVVKIINEHELRNAKEYSLAEKSETVAGTANNPEMTNLFTTCSDHLGVIRLEMWPEGLVLWVGGSIAYKSWDSKPKTTDPVKAASKPSSEKGKYIFFPHPDGADNISVLQEDAIKTLEKYGYTVTPVNPRLKLEKLVMKYWSSKSMTIDDFQKELDEAGIRVSNI